MKSRRSVLGLLAAVAIVVAGCSGSRPTLAEPAVTTATAEATTVAPTTTVPDGVSQVATAIPDEVTIHEAADATSPEKATLSNPNPNGVPLVFLVKDHQADWYEVYLPIRPNGSTGWVPADQVEVKTNPYKIVVSAQDHTLILQKDGETIRDFPVGIGQGQYPTPGGVYYIKELLAPPDPNGAYGPYAYGLSGFSEIDELANFAGGDGVIGIHGTNDPASVGASVSHGCIRMNNEDITELAEILPLGTPVAILA